MLKRVIARGSSLDGTVPESAPTFAQQVGGGGSSRGSHTRSANRHTVLLGLTGGSVGAESVSLSDFRGGVHDNDGRIEFHIHHGSTPFVNRTYRLARAGDLRMTDWTS